MTDSGKNPPKLLNDLGGHEYPQDVQQLIHTLAMALKARSEPFNDMSKMLAPGGPRPRDYIFLWTKTAGFIYELARNLEAYPIAPKVPKLELLQWLTIITDFKFAGGKKEPPPRAIMTVAEWDALTENFESTGFEVDSVSQALKEGIIKAKPKTLDSIDPEKAKAILIALTEQHPGLLSWEAGEVNGEDLLFTILALLAPL